MSNIKQVAVVRKDLKMRRGKEISQGGHGFLAFLTKRLHPDDHGRCHLQLSEVEEEWLEGSFRKVTVQIDDEEGLLEVFRRAQDAGLEVHLVRDSGLTEFDGVPTNTCLVIGPDHAERIDPITGPDSELAKTGRLKLY